MGFMEGGVSSPLASHPVAHKVIVNSTKRDLLIDGLGWEWYHPSVVHASDVDLRPFYKKNIRLEAHSGLVQDRDNELTDRNDLLLWRYSSSEFSSIVSGCQRNSIDYYLELTDDNVGVVRTVTPEMFLEHGYVEHWIVGRTEKGPVSLLVDRMTNIPVATTPWFRNDTTPDDMRLLLSHDSLAFAKKLYRFWYWPLSKVWMAQGTDAGLLPGIRDRDAGREWVTVLTQQQFELLLESYSGESNFRHQYDRKDRVGYMFPPYRADVTEKDYEPNVRLFPWSIQFKS